MYLIDTNIFLEFFLKQDNCDLAKKILKDLEEDKASFVVTNFTLHSIVVIAEKFGVLAQITKFFEQLLEFENLFIHYLNLEEELNILKNEMKLDFDDGIQLLSAKQYDATIITFDKDLLNQSEVQAIHPREY